MSGRNSFKKFFQKKNSPALNATDQKNSLVEKVNDYEKNQFNRREFFSLWTILSSSSLLSLLLPKKAKALAGFMMRMNTPNTSKSILYVDDVFSTYLYTGNGAIQTFDNGIKLASNGGMVWIKKRTAGAGFNDHILWDSAGLGSDNQTFGAYLSSSLNQGYSKYGLSQKPALPTSGFNIPSWNSNLSDNYVSWSFRKAAKFFDVVSYTGNGVAGRQITHSLGCAPGMIIIKRTSTSGSDWAVWHRTAGNLGGRLNNAGIFDAGYYSAWVNSTPPTNAVFTVGSDGSVNASASTYVAYIFAHDDSDTSFIKCDSYIGDGTGNGTKTITLGWEPQYILVKNVGTSPMTAGSWSVYDAMRGITAGGNDPSLSPNTNSLEDGTNNMYSVTARGFIYTYSNAAWNETGVNYIFVAIRRPNKPVSSGSEVFQIITRSGTGVAAAINTSFPLDAILHVWRTAGNHTFFDRLRGNRRTLTSNEALAENGTYADSDPQADFMGQGGQTTINYPGYDWNNSGSSICMYLFKRAPGFFDIVCYKGTGTTYAVNHSLAAPPELVLVKSRSAGGWLCLYSAGPYSMVLNANSANPSFGVGVKFGNASYTYAPPTDQIFTVNDMASTNGENYVAYLFASKNGVSKVGTYTGSNSSAVTVSCEFAGNARFVLIKRTDSTGDWIVADSTRGSGVYSVLNSNAVEVNTSVVTFTAGGFTTAAPGSITNASGTATYIFLAIA